MIPYSTGDGNLNEPIKEDAISTQRVLIPGEVSTVNGITDYYIGNRNIEDMSLVILKEVLVELMNEAV